MIQNNKLEQLKDNLNSDFESVTTLKDLELFRVKAFGKKSEISDYSKSLGNLPVEERKIIGQVLNQIRTDLDLKITEKETFFKNKEKQEKLQSQKIDVSMPSVPVKLGSNHPVSLVLAEITEIFKPLGYTVETGPEVEHDFYCFEALNIPSEHPARDMQDTFYLFDSVVLRTHTSPVQIRTMLKKQPPLRILAPGRVYRSDYDISHTPMFHQIEGLLVDKNITFADLKGTLLYFAQKMFGEKTKIRLRPSYFPFTEPSAEVDVTCVMCKGQGCRVCKDTGWLEILGCGMVHPNVFKSAGYNPEEVSGFAFGMGIERIAMLKYKINDLRTLFESDIRFLKQF